MAKKADTGSSYDEKPKNEVAAYNWDEFEGNTGLENLNQQDLGIPILSIIQKGSPEFDADHKDHATKKIPGVQVGDIINTVTREILHTIGKDPIKVVPYFYKLVYLEWRPREQGGGIVQTHLDPSIMSQTKKDEKTGRDHLPNGNTVVTTAYFFVRIMEGDRVTEDALITLTSTQLKKSRAWLNMMKGFTSPAGNTLPMFHRAYYLSTVGETNAKGSWRGWKIEPAPEPLKDPTVVQGLVNIARESASNATALIGSQKPDRADEDVV